MQIDIKVIRLGKLFMAATTLGGIVLRGRSAPEPGDAVRNLMWKLSGQDGDDDAKVAVELAINGTDLGAQLAVGDGSAAAG